MAREITPLLRCGKDGGKRTAGSTPSNPLAFAATSLGVPAPFRRSSASSRPAPDRPRNSSASASARNSGSFMVAAKAARSAATRSAGAALVANGRPSWVPDTTSSISWRSSGVRAASSTDGASRSGARGPACAMTVILLVLEPCRLGRLPARPGVVARLDLAALHREVDLVAAGIAGDDLELGAEELVHHLRIDEGDGAARRGAGDDLALARVLDALDAGGVPDRHGLDHRRDRAEPLHLGGVELHAGDADGLHGREGVGDHADIGAVLRRDVVEVVDHPHAAGAGHVLRHHGRDCRECACRCGAPPAAPGCRTRRRRRRRSAR